MRLIDIDAMRKPIYATDGNIIGFEMTQDERDSYNEGINYALRLAANCPTVDAVPVVRCRDCKHRPTIPEGFDKNCGGIDLEFPDDECPCKCSDTWYSWYPPDDFFCARGKQKGEDE